MVCISSLGGFNTQPPEGGWGTRPRAAGQDWRFNTQPPEGGWAKETDKAVMVHAVSTHSRPKAAGSSLPVFDQPM